MAARMRTIGEAAAWLRENDPETSFTPTALRRLVISGTLPSVRIGSKYLINLDTLEAFLAGSATPQQPETCHGIGGWRQRGEGSEKALSPAEADGRRWWLMDEPKEASDSTG